MAVVFLPAMLRSLADDQESVQVEGETVREIIRQLDARYPGMADRLCDGSRLRPWLQIVVGDSVSSLGLISPVGPDDEVHFLPAIGGG